MKYALLGYDTDGTLDAPSAEDKRSLHSEHRDLHDEVTTSDAPAVNVIAHYRFRPPNRATTLRVTDGEPVATEGLDTRESAELRTLYLLDSDDPQTVLELARTLPALPSGGRTEIRPLTEPHHDGHQRRGHRDWARRRRT